MTTRPLAIAAATLLLAGGAAFLLRRGRWAHLTRDQERSIDGASAILLGVVSHSVLSSGVMVDLVFFFFFCGPLYCINSILCEIFCLRFSTS